MIARYSRPAMSRIWSDAHRLEVWLEVELAATETLAATGVVPAAAAARIREKARVDAGVVQRIAELEAKVKHDVIAFTMAVGETIGDPDAARWLHYGLTSNDVVDTAQALQIREASRLIEHGLVRFGEVLERRAREFQHTPQIGRTHGIHAEPITFGLKVANWFAENRPTWSASARPRGKWPWGKFPAPWVMRPTWGRTWKRPSASAWCWTWLPWRRR